MVFEKYGFTLEPHEWSRSTDKSERVEKQIRMRVHRQCHRCHNSTFGPDKICTHCQHLRCKKCPRFPTKKPARKEGLPTAKTAVVAAKNTERIRAKSRYDLAIPGRVPGTQDRVLKDIKQTTRRICHRCELQFESGATVCNRCKHTRCTKCARLPYVILHHRRKSSLSLVR
jgi:hypothetical protein